MILKRTLPFVFAVFIPLAFLLCGKITDSTWTNPLLPDYKGDYRLEVAWDSLPDTLYVGKDYSLFCQTGKDTFVEIKITLPGNDTAEVVRWKSDSVVFRFSAPYSGPVVVTGVRPNQKLVQDQANVVVLKGKQCFGLPSAKFIKTKDTLSVNLNDSIELSAQDINGSSKTFVWQIGAASPESTIVGRFRVRIIDTIPLKAYVFGIDSCGQSGLRDSVFILAQNFQYRLVRGAAFPDTIRAKQEALWTVAIDSMAKFASRGGKFYWQITAGTSILDTADIELDTLRRTFSDSTLLTVSVYAKDQFGAMSAEIIQQVIVRTFRPYFKFLKVRDTTRITKPLTIRAKMFDTDPQNGGGLDSVYWDLGADGTIDARNRDSSYTVVYPLPGSYKVSARVRDNMGFWSASDTTTILVKADQPYFNVFSGDTSTYINQFITLRVHALRGESGIAIAKYYWRFTGNAGVDSTAADSIIKQFSVAGRCTVTVNCRDADGIFSANADTFVVTVSSGEPVVSGILPRTIWVKDDTLFTVNASAIKPGATISACFVAWNGDSTFVQYVPSGVRHSYATEGMKHIRLFVRDNFNMSSDTIGDSIYVKLGRPIIDSMKVDSAVFVNDSRTVTIFARDSNSSLLDSFKIIWPSGQVSSSGQSAIGHVFSIAESGNRTLKAIVMDDDSIWSDTFLMAMNIQLGKPSVVSIQKPVAPVFINDRFTIAVTPSDPNGTVDSFFISWNSGLFSGYSAAALDTVFPSSGAKQARIFVKDNDGISSDTVRDSIVIHLGKPLVTGISVDSPFVYINDSRVFTIGVYDTNGANHRPDSIRLDNGNGIFSGWRKISADTVLIPRVFSRTEAGTRTIRAFVKDDDGIISDTSSLAVNVLLGAPIVDSVRVDTAGSNLFVRDNRRYRVYCSDVNGGIKKIYAAWNGGATPDDSLAVNLAGNGFGDIYHAYDTSQWGPRTLRFWAKDDDTVQSNPKDSAVFIRLAPPVVWGDGVNKDTLFIIVNNDYGDYYYHPHYADTNGVIDTFYFGQTANMLTASKGKADSAIYNVSDLTVNKGSARYVWIKDNDGLIRSGRFVVFADSAPRPITATSDAITGGRKFSWSGLDAVDSLATMYRILVKKGSQLAAGDTTASFIAKDWTQGDDPSFGYNSADVFPFKWTYTPTQGSGAYYFQIIARDKRGSISALPLSGANVFSF